MLPLCMGSLQTPLRLPKRQTPSTLSPMDDQIVGPASRVVDIWNDDGVWAVLNEGCNSTVCGSE